MRYARSFLFTSVVRVLRLLAAHGVVDEIDVETYRSSDICTRLNIPAEEGAIRNMYASHQSSELGN